MDLLQQKLKTLTYEYHPNISSSNRIDLTTLPDHPRVSFPYPEITPYAQSLGPTGLAARLGIDRQHIKHDVLISRRMDVSSNPGGVCYVTGGLLTISNSHAGSHADQPGHWLERPPFESFEDQQYNGNTAVFNLVPYFNGSKEITPEMLEQHARETGTDLERVRRLLVRTYDRTPHSWDNNFAYLRPEAAELLGKLPNLVLFGTDAPSVDHPDASPIHEKAHGKLWDGRIAILEGLNSDDLPRDDKLEGVLQTTLLPTRGVYDAKFAVVSFYPLKPGQLELRL